MIEKNGMKSDQIIMVSAGMLSPKKENDRLNKQNLYPNYGLVSLATVLKSKGYSPVVIHGDFKDPQEIIELLKFYRANRSAYPILLSIPSFFALEWAQIFCEEVAKHFSGKKIVVGGKWVVNGNETWLKTKLKGISSFISNNAEKDIVKIINSESYTTNTNIVGNSTTRPKHLDYKLVHKFQRYQPSIEIARGCGEGCFFCLEKNVQYKLINSPKNAVKSILRHQEDYGTSEINPYFQASYFRPNKDWCSEFLKHYCNNSLTSKWRTQTRVDSLSFEKVELLSKGGLKVLDLGLESASPQQIKSMGKSKSPDLYLKRASQLLKTCYDNGVWVKLNILLYIGETFDTIKETEDWIKLHKKYIKGLSINPLFIYRYGDYDNFSNLVGHNGVSFVDENSLPTLGYACLNLSDTISYKKANEISLGIRKKIVSDRNYYDLKSFSYFDRNYTSSDFRVDVQNFVQCGLPFYRTEFTSPLFEK